jgi:pyruvate dehydrogenase E1 component alpha subunit
MRTDNMAGTIEARVRAFGIAFHRCIGNDAAALGREIAPLIERVRKTSAPLVIEFDTFRLGSHSKGDDTREPAQVARLREGDWHARYRVEYPELFALADESARDRIQAALSKVEKAPPSTWNR